MDAKSKLDSTNLLKFTLNLGRCIFQVLISWILLGLKIYILCSQACNHSQVLSMFSFLKNLFLNELQHLLVYKVPLLYHVLHLFMGEEQTLFGKHLQFFLSLSKFHLCKQLIPNQLDQLLQQALFQLFIYHFELVHNLILFLQDSFAHQHHLSKENYNWLQYKWLWHHMKHMKKFYLLLMKKHYAN